MIDPDIGDALEQRLVHWRQRLRTLDLSPERELALALLVTADQVAASNALVGVPGIERPGREGWEDAVALARGGRQTWPLLHRHGEASPPPPLLPWPLEWVCAQPVGAEDEPDPDRPRGFRELPGICLFTGALVDMNTGCRCARCGIYMSTHPPELAGLDAGNVPSCPTCREAVNAVEVDHGQA